MRFGRYSVLVRVRYYTIVPRYEVHGDCANVDVRR